MARNHQAFVQIALGHHLLQIPKRKTAPAGAAAEYIVRGLSAYLKHFASTTINHHAHIIIATVYPPNNVDVTAP